MKWFSTTRFSPFIYLFLLAFLPSNSFARTLIDKSVATVNDEIVLKTEVSEFLSKIKSQSYQELFGMDASRIQTEQDALGLLIEEKLMDQQVKKLDLAASEMEVDRQIRTILERNGISETQLKAQLTRLGTTFAEYREGIRRQIERRNLIDREIRPSLEVSDEQLKHFYRKQRGNKKSEPDNFEIAHILIGNKGSDAKKRADQIYTELKTNPELFSEKAAEYSDDEETRSAGGSLGALALDSLNESFRAVVPSTPVGGIARPVQSPQGFHIIKVLSRGSQELEKLPVERKEELRNQMVAVQLEERLRGWMQRQKQESYIRLSDEQNANRPETVN